MPVPSLVTDLSTTVASNSPAGSDNVFPDLDNYLRTLSAFLASIRDNSGNGWVSPYLPLTGGTVSGATTFSAIATLSAGASASSTTTATYSGTSSAYDWVTNSNWTKGVFTGKSISSVISTTGWTVDMTNSSYWRLGYGSVTGTPTELLRVDSAGSLGLGVAPSAWGSGIKAFDFGQGSALVNTGSTTTTWLTSNAYNNGTNFIYKNTALASYYAQTAGTHQWFTAPSGTAGNAITFTQAMTLDASGNLTINSGSLGYGTGSGGAVTQATSRTTGVTLNKTNGAITLVSAAGSTSWLSFVVNNSTVAATDTVIVNQKSGADKYLISVTGVNAGSFAITFATTGGTTTEQPVFNFAVIKAVAA